ncbi:hypothetical protein Ancab_033995 [Ancistrocladus abbreviatus]
MEREGRTTTVKVAVGGYGLHRAHASEAHTRGWAPHSTTSNHRGPLTLRRSTSRSWRRLRLAARHTPVLGNHCSSTFARANETLQTQTQMEEEFQESEIVFSDLDSDQSAESSEVGYYNCREMTFPYQSDSLRGKKRRTRRRKKKKTTSSVPVNIPENVFLEDSPECEDFDELEDGDGDMIPPHVIVARRIAGKIACSVYSANGRTLKGRNLCQVRNSILRMTGFLES